MRPLGSWQILLDYSISSAGYKSPVAAPIFSHIVGGARIFEIHGIGFSTMATPMGIGF